MIYLVTANITLLCSHMLQLLIHYYNLSRSANTQLIWSIQQQVHCYDLSRPNQYYIAIIHSVTANNTLLWSVSLQPILTYTAIYYVIQHSLWTMNTKTDRILIYKQGDHPPAAGGPPPMRIPGAARRTPRQYPRLWLLCYYIVFSVLPFVLLDICLSEDT